MYVAIISTPGYMPTSEPVAFDTAGQAWDYLADEYADMIGSVDYDGVCECEDPTLCDAHAHEAECRAVLADSLRRAALPDVGTVYVPDPNAYDTVHSLGLALSVDTINDRTYALDILESEGYAQADVTAAIDSWLDASAPDATLDMVALDVLRDQLDS